MKTKTTHTDKKDMKRTHTNWSDNSKHSLWLIRRNKLQIVVSLCELFLFVSYRTMIPIFPPNPDFVLVRSRFCISIEWQVWILVSCDEIWGRGDAWTLVNNYAVLVMPVEGSRLREACNQSVELSDGLWFLQSLWSFWFCLLCNVCSFIRLLVLPTVSQ